MGKGALAPWKWCKVFCALYTQRKHIDLFLERRLQSRQLVLRKSASLRENPVYAYEFAPPPL